MDNLIISSRKVLISDDFDMLYCGFNKSKQFVLYSQIKECVINNNLVYFISIVETDIALLFLQGLISYLDILKTRNTVYRAELDYNYQIEKLTSYTFDELNEDELPLPHFHITPTMASNVKIDTIPYLEYLKHNNINLTI